jgi:hypothetical protein
MSVDKPIINGCLREFTIRFRLHRLQSARGSYADLLALAERKDDERVPALQWLVVDDFHDPVVPRLRVETSNEGGFWAESYVPESTTPEQLFADIKAALERLGWKVGL